MTGNLGMERMDPHNMLIMGPKGQLSLHPKLNSYIIIICISAPLEDFVFVAFLSCMPVSQCTPRTSLPDLSKIKAMYLVSKHLGIS